MAYWDCCVKAAVCIGIWGNCWLPQAGTRTKTQPQQVAACRLAVSGLGSVQGTEELLFHWVEHMLTAQWYPDAGPTKEQKTHLSCTITPWYSTNQRTHVHWLHNDILMQDLAKNTYDSWSLTLRDEHGLSCFKHRVLKKIFGSVREKVTTDWRQVHNEEHHGLQF